MSSPPVTVPGSYKLFLGSPIGIAQASASIFSTDEAGTRDTGCVSPPL